nr:cobalamin-dependent protein [Ardenticatenaceae bacterium]
EIIDLGTDVPPEKFVEAVQDDVDILGLSALLTTTLSSMASTIKAIDDIREKNGLKVMIGGAPVTPDFAKQICADGYATDASQAVSVAKSLIG